MTLEEWKSLQDEFGFKIFGICYENMSFEEGEDEKWQKVK